MKCFVILIKKDKHGIQIENTQFPIEINDGSNLYDLYLASLRKAGWDNLISSNVYVRRSVYDKDYEEFGDLNDDMDKINVEPNKYHFVISPMSDVSNL